MLNLLTVCLGACALLWPAVFNGYPIVFSDTGGFLEQALMPDIGWDKPWVYGPFLTPFHLRQTLWPAIFAQAMIVSALLWLTLCRVLATPVDRRRLHLGVCAVLAVLTAAPWFASTLMPDIFASLTVLGLFLLTAPLGPATILLVAAITTLSIAAHLAHLVLAAACLVVLSLLTRRVLWRQALPLGAALALISATNFAGGGTPAISPYGSVFAVARLIANGPGRDVIQQQCPAIGWRVCAWKDRLPADSDDFLWDPHGPVWADGFGPVRYAPEASTIVKATLRAQPLAVLRTALDNTITQLGLVRIGDTLGPDHLEVAVRPRLSLYFPPAEVARFDASRQARGQLAAFAARFNALDLLVLVIGGVSTVVLVATQWRHNRPLANLAVLALAALLANAAATGALSHPHHRYQARIAWLVVLVPALAVAASLQRRAGDRGSRKP